MQPGGLCKVDVETVRVLGVYDRSVLVQKRLVERDRPFAEMVVRACVAGDTIGDMQRRRRFEETDGDVAKFDSAKLFRRNDEKRDFFRVEILVRLAAVGLRTPWLLEGRGGNEIAGIFGVRSVTAGKAVPCRRNDLGVECK